MERKVGEIFTYKGKTYQVAKNTALCEGCAFLKNSACCWLQTILGSCGSAQRKDREEVIFKEIKNMEIKNNQLTIDIPEGMEIDIENSDLTKGIVKFKPKSLTYGDIVRIYVSDYGNLMAPNHCIDRLLAISKLMNIAKYYNKDWKPNWEHRETKYYIYFNNNNNEYEIDYNDAFCRNIIYFKNSKDAKAVIDNPNFREILDAIYK